MLASESEILQKGCVGRLYSGGLDACIPNADGLRDLNHVSISCPFAVMGWRVRRSQISLRMAYRLRGGSRS